MKNRIAIKLMLYFTAVILVFAVIIGGVFYNMFKQHTIDIKEQAMIRQAKRITEVILENMAEIEKRNPDGIANSRFINYMDNVTQDVLWVVDSERNLSINTERMQRMAERHKRMHAERPELPEPPKNSTEAYQRLPERIKEKINEGFAGKSFVVQEFNPIMEDIVITVGEPVRAQDGTVKAVVLLHSPVQGLQEAVWEGIRILFIALATALVLGMVLSVVLSWRFVKPLTLMKKHAERLAERDYTVRNDIVSNDEIGDLGQTLDTLAVRLEQADEASQKLEKMRREFVANISHELRTPVTVIRGSLEALRDGVITDPEDVKEFHEQMYNESIYLQRLVNDLLDLSRLQNTDFPIEMSPFNLCDAVQDAVRSARSLGREKNIDVKGILDTELYPIMGDYGRIRQMLLVFLHNSIKFSPEGSTIEVVLEGNTLRVVDHGCGIAPEEVPQVFDRFHKAHNEQNKSGSGLGLAIAKQIALRHNMELSVTSIVDEGTTITATLPPMLEVKENMNA